ncbi:hypothetical protein [Parapedobacter sp. DT-150]|uniref:hypothetical protein n=1 Tax=Parapedobacter sp. DT-150 TaxID=3396162 RepID=UPI003F197627
MKIHQHLIASLTVAVLFTIQSCENPLKDVSVVVDTEAVQYGTAIQIIDEQGNTVSDLTVAISGEDAEYIYGMEGRQQFEITDGLLGLGVHPLHAPTESDPVSFAVQLSGEGYVSETVPITITVSQHTSAHVVQIRRETA